MSDKEHKLVKQIYLYRDSHLPKNGWIQSCMNCYLHTERKILFYTVHQEKEYYDKYWEFYTHLCNPCKKRILNKKNKQNLKENLKFQKTCYLYMKKLYPYLFSKENENFDIHICHYKNSPTNMKDELLL